MNTKTGALYIRVSTAEQAELSPDAQKRLLLDYAKKNDIRIPSGFIFMESVSGRHAQRRPQFQRMIATARQSSHPVDVILVWKYSRFARNQEESIVYKSMLKKDSVEVVSVSEPLIDGPFGSLIERIIEWMDEYYSTRLSGEVLRGMKEKALRNGYQSSPCLGYQACGGGRPFLIQEEEYRTVSYIMDLYDNQNMDETAIARKCNDVGFRTKRGNLFERRSIDAVLRNPFYCGIVSWDGISFEGSHEIRLSKERYEQRQKLLDTRKRPAKARSVSTCRHWLSGVIRCSVCGATLSYAGACFQCWKYAKGFHRGSCALSVKTAESAVLDFFGQLPYPGNCTYLRRTAAASLPSRRASLNAELSQIALRESRVKDAYESGIDTLGEYRASRARLASSRKKLEAEIAESALQAEGDLPDDGRPKEIHSVNDVLEDSAVGYEEKGTLLRTVVDQLVYDREAGCLYFDIIIS